MRQLNTTRHDYYLEKYEFVVEFIADLHLNGEPLVFHDEEVETREFCRRLIQPLQDASIIVLLGDTIDRTATTNFKTAKRQLHILFETLEEFNLIEKLVIILGNHDYDSRYFLWRKPLLIRPYIRMSLYPYRDVIIHHGDNLGLESLMKKTILRDSDIRSWRKTFSRPVGGKKIRPTDIFVVGHTHHKYGFCNRKEFTLAVPSAKKILHSASNSHLGYVGMFCFSANDDHWDWNIAIESPITQI